MSICFCCYQDYLIHEKIIEIEDPEKAKQSIEKVETWLKSIKILGKNHSIDQIYDTYFSELNEYENKLKKIKKKLERPNKKDIFLLYTKIKIKTLDLLKELDLSKVMHNYKTHLAHLSFRGEVNKVRKLSKFNSQTHKLIMFYRI